jgi:protein kinase-like protein
VSGERTGSASDVTQREFVGGQRLFGRYTLIRILGRGGMGIVWLAHDEELERDVALKFLPDLIIHDAAVLSDLKRETKRCLELTHKNIVRIHDFVHGERSGCISMEYVDGDTLSSLRCDKERKVTDRRWHGTRPLVSPARSARFELAEAGGFSCIGRRLAGLPGVSSGAWKICRKCPLLRSKLRLDALKRITTP